MKTWPERKVKRERAVEQMKTTPAYEAVMAARANRATVLDELPLTPDPTDESVHKRQWERKFMVWRNQLKEFQQKRDNDRGDGE